MAKGGVARATGNETQGFQSLSPVFANPSLQENCERCSAQQMLSPEGGGRGNKSVIYLHGKAVVLDVERDENWYNVDG